MNKEKIKEIKKVAKRRINDTVSLTWHDYTEGWIKLCDALLEEENEEADTEIEFYPSFVKFNPNKAIERDKEKISKIIEILADKKNLNAVVKQATRKECFKAFEDAWSNCPSQDNEGYLPDRGGFKTGWFSALDWVGWKTANSKEKGKGS